MKEAWQIVQGWYQDVEDREPTPCWESMARQTKERVELYAKVDPPGIQSQLTLIGNFPVNNETPEDAELRDVVKGLCNGRAGGVSGIRAEHMKEWLTGMIEEEEQGTEGKSDRWRLFVKLINTI